MSRALGVLAAVAALLACVPAARAQEPPAADAPLAIGLAEYNPSLITPAQVARPFRRWRDRTAALRPRYFRLLVDWSDVQPSARRRPDWRKRRDGCVRDLRPCSPYRGIGAVLRAVRRRQQRDGGWEVVVTPYFAPRWATSRRSGCPNGGRIRLRPYRRFLRSLQALGRRERVQLRLWSPWNEPNHPAFLRPQRSRCSRRSPSVAPAAYARLVRAARAELGPEAEVVVGELAGYRTARPTGTSVVEFVEGLPQDVVCGSRVWAQHTYVYGRRRGDFAADLDPGGNEPLLRALQSALDARGCPEQHRIWITETGAFPHRRACQRMDSALRTWAEDPRVDAAFQYLVREDPKYRTGLATPTLRRARPAYAAWRAWARAPTAAGPSEEPCR